MLSSHVYVQFIMNFLGHYSVVSYDVEDMINETDHYCAYTPYMFAYVLLIMQWTVLPILLCCYCTIVWTTVCGAVCCGLWEGFSKVYSAAETEEPQSSA